MVIMSIENESIIDINNTLKAVSMHKTLYRSGSDIVEVVVEAAKEKIGKIEIRRKPKYLPVAADPNKNYI